MLREPAALRARRSRRGSSPTSPFGLGLRLSARDARELLDRHRPRRVPRLSRRRGAVRRADQRLSLRAVPRHAGQGQRLRARLARSTARVAYTLDLIRHPAGAGARRRRRRRLDRAALLQAVDGRGRQRRLGDDHRATSSASPKRWRGPRRTRARSSISISSRSPTARSRTPPRRSSSSSAACCRRARRCSRARSDVAESAARDSPARAHPHLFRLLPLRGRVRGRRRGAEAVPRARASRSAACSSAPRSTSRSRPTRTRQRRVIERLRPFADSTYLHQVVERRGGELRHFLDLPRRARAAPRRRRGATWRIHFHVPLFTAEYDALGSTQDYVADGPAPRRCATQATTPPRDRNLHVGRAARRPQARSARVDRARIRVGAADVSRSLTERVPRGRRSSLRVARREPSELRPEQTMHKTVVLNVVGLTPTLIARGAPRDRAWARDAAVGPIEAGVSRRHLHGAVRLPHRRRIPTRTASSATAGTCATTARSGSGGSRTGWCRRRRSGRPRAPRIRRSPARTCSGGSTCIRRRTQRHAAADVSGRRPQAAGRLHHAGRLRDELQAQLGTFPLFDFWGPRASIASTRWIAEASKHRRADSTTRR